MASIGELKRRAKEKIGNRYWKVFLASLIGTSLASAYGSFSSSTPTNSITEMVENGNIDVDAAVALLGVFSVLSFFTTLLSCAIYIFVSGPAQVGLSKYFVENAKGNAVLLDIFSGFKTNYWGNAKVMFLVMLKTYLWTLLFIVPGIIKSFEYAMVPYILAENPNISSKEAFSLSKEMMRGRKWKLFVLGLSFMGWYLLGLLACCVGIMFVQPYACAATAEFYLDAKYDFYNIVADAEIVE